MMRVDWLYFIAGALCGLGLLYFETYKEMRTLRLVKGILYPLAGAYQFVLAQGQHDLPDWLYWIIGGALIGLGIVNLKRAIEEGVK